METGTHKRFAFAITFVAASLSSQSGSGLVIGPIARKPPNMEATPFHFVCRGLHCVGKVIHDVGRAGGKAASDAGKAVGKAANDAGKAIGKAADDTGKAVSTAVKDTTVTIEKAGNDTITTIVKAGGDTIKTVEKAGGDVTRTVQKAGGDTITTVRKAGGDVVTTYHKAGSDTVTVVQKGFRDVGDQAKREFKDLVDAGTAVGKFAVDELKADASSLAHAERLIREGKVVDAIWALQTEPMKNVEANAATAVQESSLLNEVAQGVATFYGGPAGAAAYSAWYTYRATGSANMALRVGLKVGLTSTLAGAAGQMPSGTALEVAKKSLVSGAIGGLTVAAAGGNADSIKKSFLEAGSKILVQDGYQQVAGQPLDSRVAARVAYCMSAPNTSCLPKPQDLAKDAAGNLLDAAGRKLDPDGTVRDAAGDIVKDVNGLPTKGIPKIIGQQLASVAAGQIGPWVAANDHSLNEEKAAVMTTLSNIPGTNSVAILGGAWTLSWNASTADTASLVYPAVVLTNAGDQTPLYERVQDVAASAADSVASAAPPAALPKLNYYRSYVCTGGDTTQAIDIVSDGEGCRVSYDAGPAGVLTLGIGSHSEQNECAPIAATKAAELKSVGLACLAR